MRLTFIKLLLAFPLILVVLAAVSACDGFNEYDSKPTLTAPQIAISESDVNWESIEHAACYEVYENSTLVKTVEETSYHIVQTAKGTYKYKVKALSADENYSSSKFSNEVVYVVTNDKLATPKISISNGVISWEAVEHAGGYQVFEGGELVSQQSTTSYTVPHTETGVYKYTVKAISISGEYLASDLSNEVTHIVSERLAAPLISIAGKVISWQAVAHAETYVIYENGVVLYQAYTRTSYEIEQTKVGDYTYYVVARSSNPAYSMSENSNSVNYTIEPTVLATPDGLKVEDGQLEWTESVGAGYYEIYEDGIIVAKQSHSPYRIPIDHEPGTFSFTVKAFPAKDDKQYLESGISESCSHTVSDVRVQLATPANLRCDKREEYKNPALEDGTHPDGEKVTKEFLIWDPVPHAGAYFIYEDGSFIEAQQSTEVEITEKMPGNHKYQVKAIATEAGYRNSELSVECIHTIEENKSTEFKIHFDTTSAGGLNSNFKVELWLQDKNGLSLAPVADMSRPVAAGQGEIILTYSNKDKYIAKLSGLPEGYVATQLKLSAMSTEGTISIYAKSGMQEVKLNTPTTVVAKSELVGISQSYLFVAPKKGSYRINPVNDMICDLGGFACYAFNADQNEAVVINVNCQIEGSYNLEVIEPPAKQYINYGDIGFDGATGPSNTIYNGQREATFYLHASSEAKRYTFMFTTATMGNNSLAVLTVNGKSYEFDGTYLNEQSLLIPASETDTEITIKVYGEATGAGLDDIAFYVIPL